MIKLGIRKKLLALREQLSPDVRAACSEAISARIFKLEIYRQANAVLGYMNFGAEFASELWIQQVLADGKKVALPRVNRHTNQLDLYWVDDLENQLESGLWGIREPVVERCEQLTTLNEVEFALLPGVAFSRNGARLGYGGGFYDKLLMKQLAIRLGEQTALHSHSADETTSHSTRLPKDGNQVAGYKSPKNGDISRWLTPAKSLVIAPVTHRPALVAAAFALQIVEQIPQEATDVKVEWIITEQETIACSE